MRIVSRAAAIIGLRWRSQPPARAVCSGNCEPSVEVAQAAMQKMFRETFLSPYTLVSFERLDGRSGERYGGVFYEMRIRAVLHYDGIRLRCRRPSCPELHHYLMENDAASKKVDGRGLALSRAGRRRLEDRPPYSRPSMMRMSRTAPLPSARKASW